MCDEQTIKEMEALRAALNELCAAIIKKQIANQLHIPDNFNGIKEIKTCGYEVEEMEPSKLCMGVVKVNAEWYVCNKEGELLPINSLGVQSLHNVENALLKVWECILDWEAQWD